jgi:hypothetical protein
MWVTVGPHQRLPNTSYLNKFIKYQKHRFLRPLIRVLPQVIVVSLFVAYRAGNDELTPGALSRIFDRSLAQQIKLALIQVPFKSQQQPIITLTWRRDGLVID